MIIPEQAVRLCTQWEGLADLREDGMVYPYLCPAGHPTQGYGTLVESLSAPPITPKRAGKDLLAGLSWRLAGVYRLCPALLNEPEHRAAAVLSFAYNLGLGRLKASTLRERINEKDWAGAEAEFHKWVHAGGRKLAGLIARRADEARVFSGV